MFRILFGLCLGIVSCLTWADCLSSPRLTGVNLAGAEFAPHALPGKMDQDFVYPTEKTLRYFQSQGVNTFRVPVLWERIQPTLQSELDPIHIAQLNRLIHFAAQNQLCLIIDLHNYGRYQGKPLTANAQATSQLTDVWLRLAALQPSGNNIALGLMNEPEALSRPDWFQLAQQVLLRLRQNDLPHWIFVSGGDWSGAHSWFAESGDEASNATLFSQWQDPLQHSSLELHQYADRNGSGKTVECVEPFVLGRYLQQVAQWAQSHQQSVFLGEFGMAASQTCLTGLQTMLQQLQQPSWKGWTYWAAGEWWQHYAFSIQPDAAQPNKPQFSSLKPYLSH